MSSSNAGDPIPKAKKPRLVGASDRVVLNVGGETFVTTATTLTSSSAHFAALLSDEWIDGHEGDEIFLDQDPVAFRKLLAYMRCGVIKLENVDTDLLILAEFLGVEQLLLAAKARWYVNIGKGPVPEGNDGEEIAAAFDREHGGVMKAITSGLYPMFLKRDDLDAEKEYINIYVDNDPHGQYDDFEELQAESVRIKETNSVSPQDCTGGVVGALNGLHHLGYTMHERQFLTDAQMLGMKFSRRKHSAVKTGGGAEVFIPSEKETGSSHVKQFVMTMTAAERGGFIIIAPAEFSERSEVRDDPFAATTLVDSPHEWLEKNGFVTREEGFEEQFKVFFNLMGDQLRAYEGRIYSRIIAKA